MRDRNVDVDIFLAESDFQLEALKRRQLHSADDVTAWFVSPEDLILLKLIAHRERDLLDIQDVLLIQGKLDDQYMHGWAKQLGVEQELDVELRKARHV